MEPKENINKALYEAFTAYKRRGGYRSDRQAIIALMTEAGYKKTDLFYDYLHNKRRPKGDKRPTFARILRRRVEILWPEKGE